MSLSLLEIIEIYNEISAWLQPGSHCWLQIVTNIQEDVSQCAHVGHPALIFCHKNLECVQQICFNSVKQSNSAASARSLPGLRERAQKPNRSNDFSICKANQKATVQGWMGSQCFWEWVGPQPRYQMAPRWSMFSLCQSECLVLLFYMLRC